jgi:hypothetical protein
VARDVVETHGNFHQHAIQRQKDVEHLPGVTLVEDLIADFRIAVPLRHGIHSAFPSGIGRTTYIIDSESKREREIETIDGPYRSERTEVKA